MTARNGGLNRLSASVRIWTNGQEKENMPIPFDVLIAFRLQSEFGQNQLLMNQILSMVSLNRLSASVRIWTRLLRGATIQAFHVLIAFRLQSEFGQWILVFQH